LTHHRLKAENSFCRLMAGNSRSCATCLHVQHQLAERAHHEAHTITCQAGLFETAVPVRTGGRLIAFLCTGQAFRKQPSSSQFDHVAKLAVQWGIRADAKALRAAYFNSPVVLNEKHHALVDLLTLFAQHLALLSNQIMIQEQNAEPPAITRAREFIKQHQTENLSLGIVALAVNMNKFNFCKVFKKATGINFAAHVSRTRLESAKNLLLNPNLRVSEIAYHVGFGSLTHFNRAFKSILGQSPSDYRAALPLHRALAAPLAPRRLLDHRSASITSRHKDDPQTKMARGVVEVRKQRVQAMSNAKRFHCDGGRALSLLCG
jgi:AraC-like DNA-binding protein/ligand-binding sensor protein